MECTILLTYWLASCSVRSAALRESMLLNGLPGRRQEKGAKKPGTEKFKYAVYKEKPMERASTGVRGFDDLIQGGFPKNSDNVICGPPGSGKTIFGLQFLYHGCMQNEPGVYVSVEEDSQKLIEQANQFSWDLAKLQHEKKLCFVKVPVDTVDTDLLKLISDAVDSMHAERLVIDSLSILGLNWRMYNLPIKTEYSGGFGSPRKESSLVPGFEMQQFIYLLLNYLSEWKITTVCLSDSDQGRTITRDSVSEYICDGLIRLDVREFGKTVVRTVEVKKMRSTRVNPGVHTLDFTNNGLEISEFKW